MSEWSIARSTIGAPRRGGGEQEKIVWPNNDVRFASMAFTWSWGAQPADGKVQYVSKTSYPPIISGASMELDCYGKKFYGVIKGGPAIQTNADGTMESVPTFKSSAGRHLEVSFVDTREYLSWDQVFCAYNLVDKRVYGGQRVRRYKHMRPWRWAAWSWAYTDVPYTAAQIIRDIMAYNVTNPYYAGQATIGTPWSGTFHVDMERYPVFNIDALEGRTLDDVLVEISEKLGLMFTLQGGPFHLLWARRGEGVFPSFPTKSDDQEARTVLSGNPTRIMVVGDRNLYLVLNLTLGHDWNRNWEELLTVDRLTQDLFENEADPVTGKAYKSASGVPAVKQVENAQGWQLASARARELTVRQYAALRASRDGKDFTDLRKFQGRSRMDIPAVLYLDQILFRAFRPPQAINIGGVQVPISILQMADDCPATVSHDFETGLMSWSLVNVVGGNGYAIGKGFSVDPAMIAVHHGDKFDADKFHQSLNIWTPLGFQIDDSGEDGGFVIMDQPVMKLDDLILAPETEGYDWLNGYVVMKANPTYNLPEVRAALVFEGDRYHQAVMLPGTIIDPNNATRDVAVTEGGLRMERIVNAATGVILTEIPYADGQSALYKAQQIAYPLLARPYAWVEGSYVWQMSEGDTPPDLTSMISRITFENSDQGHTCRIELTAERAVRTYAPERDYDRTRRQQNMLPRQQELMEEARQSRALAAALKQSPGLVREMNTMFARMLGDAPVEGTATTNFDAPSGLLRCGTPVRKAPNARVTHTETDPTTGTTTPKTKIINTPAVMPGAATSAHTEFVGVVVRENEDPANQAVRVKVVGMALARVKGPVAFGNNLQLPVDADVAGDYLVRQSGSGLVVARSQDEAVKSGVIKLIKVQLGGGGGGAAVESVPRWG